MSDTHISEHTLTSPPDRRTWRVLPKWALLGAFWIAQAVVVYLIGSLWFGSSFSVDSNAPWGDFSLEELLDAITDSGFLLVMGVYLSGVTVLQALLLLPVRRPRPIRERGSSLWASIAAAGLVIAGLWLGAILLVVTLVCLAWDGHLEALEWLFRDLGARSWMFLVPLALGWAIATPLLAAFIRRGRRETVLARISTRVLQGTVVEVVAIIPLDVMVRRKTDCYCGTGTFWALTLCFTAGIVLAGPAVMFTLLSRRRRRWYEGKCEVCGYDMTGLLNADRCPECGSGWAPERDALKGDGGIRGWGDGGGGAAPLPPAGAAP